MPSNTTDLMMISDLLFTYDTLIFYVNDPRQIHHIKYFLLCFEAFLGIKNKLGKRETSSYCCTRSGAL